MTSRRPSERRLGTKKTLGMICHMDRQDKDSERAPVPGDVSDQVSHGDRLKKVAGASAPATTTARTAASGADPTAAPASEPAPPPRSKDAVAAADGASVSGRRRGRPATIADYDATIKAAIQAREQLVVKRRDEARREHDRRLRGLDASVLAAARQGDSQAGRLVEVAIEARSRPTSTHPKGDATFRGWDGWDWRQESKAAAPAFRWIKRRRTR